MDTHRLVSMAIVSIGLGIMLAACEPRPSSVPSPIPSPTAGAKNFLEAGNWSQAFSVLEADLLSINKVSKGSAVALVTPYPQFIPGLLAELKSTTKETKLPSVTIVLKRRLESVRKTGLADPAQIDACMGELAQEVREGNRSGRLPFTFDDQIDEFPLLSEPAAMAIIFERSLRALEEKKGIPSVWLVRRAFAYVQAKGPASLEFQMLKQSLPNIAFSPEQLRGYVQELFPEFVAEALQDKGIKMPRPLAPLVALPPRDMATQRTQTAPPTQSFTDSTENIPLTKKGGVYQLPVEINGVLTLNFVIDSGAAEVNIPADVALTLVRTGTIKDTDFLPGKTYVLADGSQLRSPRFLIRGLKIGHQSLTNISASVGNISSSLLLGQSFLEKLGTWGVDNQKQVLTIRSR